MPSLDQPTPTKPTRIIDVATRVASHANPRWKKLALLIIKRIARRRETFTTNAVLEKLARYRIKTHDLRAIGALMIRARNAGWVERVGLVRRNDAHSRGATTLWRSRLFHPKPAADQPEVSPSTPTA